MKRDKDFELNLEGIVNKISYLIVLLDDFNARSKCLYKCDITASKDSKIDIETALFSSSQIINESTHVLNNRFSCIDFMFTSKLNLVIHVELYWPSLRKK